MGKNKNKKIFETTNQFIVFYTSQVVIAGFLNHHHYLFYRSLMYKLG